MSLSLPSPSELQAMLNDVTAVDGVRDERPISDWRGNAIPASEARWWSILDTNGHVARTIVLCDKEWGRVSTARLLAPALALHIGVPVSEVTEALSRLATNLCELLDSPQGWVMLGEYVREFVGAAAKPPFIVSLN